GVVAGEVAGVAGQGPAQHGQGGGVGAAGGQHEQVLHRVVGVGVAGAVGQPGGGDGRIGLAGGGGCVDAPGVGPGGQGGASGAGPPGGQRRLVGGVALAARLGQDESVDGLVDGGEPAADTDGAQLLGVADGDDLRARGLGGGDEAGQRAVVDHRGLVDDEHVDSGQALAGIDAVQPGSNR